MSRDSGDRVSRTEYYIPSSSRDKSKKEKKKFRLKKKEDRYEDERYKNQQNQDQRFIQDTAKRYREERLKGQEEGLKKGEAFFNRQFQGLSPQQKSAMQYEAERNINRSAETANRRLLGEQSMRGIGGKGGVGYEQQRQLQRTAQDARSQVGRDIERLNQDFALKKQAAVYAAGQGESIQTALDRQQALDELAYQNQLKRQKEFDRKYRKQWERI